MDCKSLGDNRAIRSHTVHETRTVGSESQTVVYLDFIDNGAEWTSWKACGFS
jgi:hypothetical protein